MTDRFEQLRERLAELTDLRNAAQLLEWDQQTMMPPRGARGPRRVARDARADQPRACSSPTRPGGCSRPPRRSSTARRRDSDDASLVRVARRQWEKARRVPSELAADLARAASVGQEAWVEARERTPTSPHSRRTWSATSSSRAATSTASTEFDCPYDVLLDDFEPGMTTAEVAALFAELKAELRAADRDRLRARRRGRRLVPARSASRSSVSASWSRRPSRRWASTAPAGGSTTPCTRSRPASASATSGSRRAGTRATSRTALYGAMHECGHGLYEAGIAAALQRTPLGTASRSALHESQSRLWENMVGRGRPFCGVLAPRIAELFGGPARDLDADALYRAVNRSQPSFIRVEADEATYGLHIVLRFELEQELIEGRLAVRDLPEAWNARFKEYLGVEVPDDAHGVLQDVHWSAGLIGYFPTYALGNLIAGQLWERAHADMPDLEEQLAAGELHAAARVAARARPSPRLQVHRPRAARAGRRRADAVAPFVAYLKAQAQRCTWSS